MELRLLPGVDVQVVDRLAVGGRAGLGDARPFDVAGVTAIDVSNDGAALAAALGTDVRLVAPDDGKELARWTAPTKVVAVAVSEDRATVAAAGGDGTLHVWRVAGGEPVPARKTPAAITSLAWSGDAWRFPSWVFIVFYMALDLVGLLMDPQFGGGVNYIAHLGGWCVGVGVGFALTLTRFVESTRGEQFLPEMWGWLGDKPVKRKRKKQRRQPPNSGRNYDL